MSDLFKSDYVTAVGTTQLARPAAAPASADLVAKEDSTVTALDPRSLGIEPARYGLGKPVRVVIRGKITRD